MSTSAPNSLSFPQLDALKALKNAITAAHESGLFDELAAFTHPDTINTFCDAVDEMAKGWPL